MQDDLRIFQRFRQELYKSFPKRRDSIAEILDSLSSNDRARSVVELSMNPLHQRGHSALYKGIEAAYVYEESAALCSLEAKEQMQLLLEAVGKAQTRSYQLFGLDETPSKRLYAKCLADRQTVHSSTTVAGQRPISVGHNYSVLAVMPEVAEEDWQHWAIPMSAERVSSSSNAIETGLEQIEQLASCAQLSEVPLKVAVVDSRYANRGFIHPMYQRKDWVVIARVPKNRVFYQSPKINSSKTRPRWYAEKFDLKDPSTWPVAQHQQSYTYTTSKGKSVTLEIQGWSDLLMRGTRQFSMHQCPFELIRIQPQDETGHPCGNSVWLIVCGTQRRQLSPLEVRQAYARRFDLEHFFGFAKTHLLLTSIQTPELLSETNWFRLACLAYDQLWMARHLVEHLPLPWQMHLSAQRDKKLTPRMIQRGFFRLIRQIGSMASPPKPRGISPGRAPGTQFHSRPLRPLIKFRPSRPHCNCKDSKPSEAVA